MHGQVAFDLIPDPESARWNYLLEKTPAPTPVPKKIVVQSAPAKPKFVTPLNVKPKRLLETTIKRYPDIPIPVVPHQIQMSPFQIYSSQPR